MKVKIEQYTLDESHLLDWATDEGKNHAEGWVSSYAQSIQEWYDQKDYILVNTSGSTGSPKPIRLKKSQMKASALKTADRFELVAGMKSLHCLPSQYIAGKMMLIRALVIGMDQICLRPKLQLQLDRSQTFDFAAMTPMQAISTLEEGENCLDGIKTIILGGGPIGLDLKKSLADINSHCYATYGMTETITHVALAPMNGPAPTEIFEALNGIYFTEDNEHLVIHADHLDGPFRTNDRVRLIDKTHFTWLGRTDNVINSGGVKIQPEIIEKEISSMISDRFIIVGLPDQKSGERVALLIESEPYSIEILSELRRQLEAIPKLHQPKSIHFIDRFKETNTGKIIRRAAYFGESPRNDE